MKAANWKIAAACLAAAWTLVSYGSPAYAGDGAEVTKDVRVKVIKCDGDECAELTEGMKGIEDIEIIASDGMAKQIVIRKVDCDGEDCPEHGGHHKMVFVGDGGDVQVTTGDEGHAWVSRLPGLGSGGYLGVGLTELTPELREHFGVAGDAGVMVAKVMDDSPAFKAGVQVGDIITSVDGKDVASGSALAEVIRAREAGDDVRLEVRRGGVAQTITAAIETRNAGLAARPMGDAHHGLHKIMIHCDSEDEDCGSNMEIAGLDDIDCGGGDDCRIEVECKDGECKCSINGVVSDCADIPGVPAGLPGS